MQTQRGFIGVGLLIAIVLGVIVLGGGAYFVMQQNSPLPTPTENNLDNSQILPTNSQQQTQTNQQPTAPKTSVTPPSAMNTPVALPAQSSGRIVQIEGPFQGVEGSLHITAVSPDSPAMITLWYANLPPRASGLMVCTESGACTEWRESLIPSSQEGTHTIKMSVQNAFGPNSTKGLSPGRYMVVATGSNFSERITQSNFFSIRDAQKALGPVSCTLDVKTTSGVGNYQGSGVRYIDIKRGESITVTWNGTNANYVVHQEKEVAISGTVTLTPINHESHIWTFYGTGEAGDISCGITVTINN
jgi:hypothetical protein